ncbi:diguanylate cyclase (GGDEF)-like protein [Chitinivorax tropicus]|uniref:Diguanylate cyclase (GGDEF)-like protein n=1 Tax=Chitinivorax tropicus TaxID=714531 RepID=A0A840MDE7_9PROT|nr:EAL domain-containing protein [Chitinivorax tropicus]MBB5017334.1 diguanylate cyclase (GGDEF)-like protein [Chitinivorax tropicus]
MKEPPTLHPPIRKQIISIGLWLTGCTLLALAALMTVLQLYELRQRVVAELTTQARIVSANSTAAILFSNPQEASEILGSLKEAPQIVQAKIILPDGTELAKYRRASSDTPCYELTQAKGERMDFNLCGIAIFQPITLHGERVGMLGMEQELSDVYQKLAIQLGIGMVLAGLAFGGAVRIWRALSTRLAQPLVDLVQVTQQVKETQNFSLRAYGSGSAEAHALADSFNAMMDQLELRDSMLHRELGQRRQAERRLNDLAYIDSVTGLHNRHFFMERIVSVVAEADRTKQSCALLFIDLDGFKQINDTLGHDCGDELLRQVGQRLIQALRSDDIICRMGGDEFTIIIDGVRNPSQAEMIGTKVLTAIGEPYNLHGRTGHVSGSIGVCLYPDLADDVASLLRYADSAMYEAKNSGKNALRMYSPKQDAHLGRREQLSRDLHLALEPLPQFWLAYQPKVYLSNGNIVGFEALLRWRHPVLGEISPGEFIELAESSHVILQIGQWVLREAARQLLIWREQWPHLQMSVNISARQLAEDHSINQLCEILAETGLPPGVIELELTETLMVDRSIAILDRLNRLRVAGFSLSIDDFGTGYSSLAYLDSFPITGLKIDRAFVTALAAHTHGMAIASAIMAIGNALDLQVVAEGVETQVQADALAALGCLYAQGYLYGKPLPVEAATLRLQEVEVGQ